MKWEVLWLLYLTSPKNYLELSIDVKKDKIIYNNCEVDATTVMQTTTKPYGL